VRPFEPKIQRTSLWKQAYDGNSGSESIEVAVHVTDIEYTGGDGSCTVEKRLITIFLIRKERFPHVCSNYDEFSSIPNYCHAWRQRHSPKHRATVQTILPEEVAISWIKRTDASRTWNVVDPCATACNVEVGTIPGGW
jgi:hypothetical protein